jgi:hypothetical protein
MKIFLGYSGFYAARIVYVSEKSPKPKEFLA